MRNSKIDSLGQRSIQQQTFAKSGNEKEVGFGSLKRRFLCTNKLNFLGLRVKREDGCSSVSN